MLSSLYIKPHPTRPNYKNSINFHHPLQHIIRQADRLLQIKDITQGQSHQIPNEFINHKVFHRLLRVISFKIMLKNLFHLTVTIVICWFQAYHYHGTHLLHHRITIIISIIVIVIIILLEGNSHRLGTIVQVCHAIKNSRANSITIKILLFNHCRLDAIAPHRLDLCSHRLLLKLTRLSILQ